MDAMQFDDKQNDLVRHTIDACQNAITRALENPSQAIGLARGIESALTSLQLVEQEVAKGEAGAAAVTENAQCLTRAAHVLKLASENFRDGLRECVGATRGISHMALENSVNSTGSNSKPTTARCAMPVQQAIF